MNLLTFHHYANLALTKLGLLGLTGLSVGLIALGLYIVLALNNRAFRALGIIAMGAGCILGAYTLGDQAGGAACRATSEKEALQRQLLDQQAAYQSQVSQLKQQLDAANALAQLTAAQREQLEKDDAERTKIFEEYKTKRDKEASTCRMSTDDDARVVCAIAGYTAPGCASYPPTHSR